MVTAVLVAAFAEVALLAQQISAPAATAADADQAELARLAARIAETYQSGQYGEGAELARRAITLAEQLLGRDDPNTLSFVQNLATFYLVERRFAEAEPLYRRVLEGRERVFGRDDARTLSSADDLGGLYGHQARFAEAEQYFRRALDGRERVAGRESESALRSRRNLGLIYLQLGRYAEAEPLLLRAADGFERVLGRDDPDTLVAVSNLAGLFHYTGRYEEAGQLYRRALEGQERIHGRDHPDTLRAVNNLATLYDNEGRYAEAEPLYLRALQGRERVLGREDPETLISINNIATMFMSQGRDAAAESLYLRALEGREHLLGRDHPDTLESRGSLALVYVRQGRYSEAETLALETAQASERVLGIDHPMTIVRAGNLAYVGLLRAKIPASSLLAARRVVSSLRARAAAGGLATDSGEQRHGLLRHLPDYFTLLPNAAWASVRAGRGDRLSLRAEAFTALQDAMTGAASRAVVRSAVRHIADEAAAGLGALVRERESLTDQLAANVRGFGEALATGAPEAESIRQRLRAHRLWIEARLAEIDATVRRDFPQYFALVQSEAVDIAAAQAMLGSDEAVLMVVPTRFGTHIMAISRTDASWVRSDWTTEQVDGAVRRLLGDIRAAMADEHYSYDRRTAYALYRELIVPANSLLAGKRHIFIAASGPLTSLPFGILVTQEPQGSDEDPETLRATSWFADEHALIQIPSVQSLQFLRRFRGAPRHGDLSRSFVGFGDPLLRGQAVQRGHGRPRAAIDAPPSAGQRPPLAGLADVNQLRQLNRLPGTAVELQNMRIALRAPSSSLFLAGRATEGRIRAMDLSRTRVLALATHGLMAGEAHGVSEPGLVFTPPPSPSDQDDGFLTASEVASLRLDAEWVILSACNTAAGDGSEGAPGFSGLARAFFYAGARNLLASHWPVADEAAPRLTVRTIELMRQNPGLSRAEALQRSMREIREDPNHAAWAHPGVWAPFTLIGDGAS